MKKLIAIVLVFALLTMAGCQKSSGRSHRNDRDDDSGFFLPGTKKDEEPGNAGGEVSFSGAEENASAQAESADYELVTVDNSLRNSNGDVLVSRTYVKVVLREDSPAYASINALIEEDCRTFLNSDLYSTAEELEEMVENMGYGYNALFSDADAMVVHNGDGYLSIRIGMGWFMGGVCTYDIYGLTYDLTTGEAVKIQDILGLPDEEALKRLQEMAEELLVGYYGEDGLLMEPAEVLANYTLDDYRFYLENGELILCFYTYEFACGAAGPAMLHTGIFVGE